MLHHRDQMLAMIESNLESVMAARLVLPPAIGQAINLLKESAVLSVITVPELTKVAGEVSNLTFSAIAPYLTAALLYWIAVEALARAGDAAERHLAVGKS